MSLLYSVSPRLCPTRVSVNETTADFDVESLIYRKTFARSDFSRTLRDLGLTPSAVSPAGSVLVSVRWLPLTLILPFLGQQVLIAS